MTLANIRQIAALLTSPPLLEADQSPTLRDLLLAANADAATTEVFTLIPNIYSVGADLVGLPGLNEPTRILVMAAARQIGVDISETLAIIDYLFNLLTLRAISGEVHLDDWPFLFHKEAWNDAQHSGRQDVYRALAPHCHRALRRLEARHRQNDPPVSDESMREILYRDSVVCRHFLRSVRSTGLPTTTDLDAPLPSELIRQAFDTTFIQARYCRPVNHQTLAMYRDRCLALLAGDRRAIRGRHLTEWQPIHAGGGREAYICRHAGRDMTLTISIPPDAAEEGEAPGDYVETLTAASVRYRSRKEAHSVGGAQVRTPWDPDVPHPPQLTLLYRRLFRHPPDTMTPFELAAAQAMLLSLHHGLDGEAACNVRLSEATTLNDGGYVLDPKRLLISHELPVTVLGYRGRYLDPTYYLPGGPRVSLPLVPLLAAICRRYWVWRQHQPTALPFLLVQDQDGVRPLTLGELDEWLQFVVPGINTTRLRRAHERLYLHAGLEPVLADLIQNRVQFIHLSTAFYVNLSLEQLAMAHHQAYTRVTKWIVHNQPEVPQWIREAGVVVTPPPDRVGSCVVPRLQSLREFFHELKVRLEAPVAADPEAIRRSHNLFSAYVALSVAWATGIRPRLQPVLDRRALQDRSEWAVIRDKDNGRFQERRPVPLCATVRTLLYALDSGLEHVCSVMGREGCPVSLPDGALFVVIGRKGTTRPLGSDEVRAILEREGLHYPWKLNAARHYWMSTAIARGRPLAVIEPFLGHLHEHQEPWGHYSLAELTPLGNVFQDDGEAILAEIGIGALAHPIERLLAC